MLKIGEFARLCGTGTQTIRYYDSVGILPADHVDTFTGYRYYSSEKLETYRLIKLYQEIGFTLEEIKCLLSEPADEQTREARETLLTSKRRTLAGELDAVQGKLARLEKISRERQSLAEKDFSEVWGRAESFENDERVLGRWELLGELDAPPDGEAPPPEAPLIPMGVMEPIFQRMVFLPEGKPWWIIYWSRGTVYYMFYDYRTIFPLPYTLWEREDGRYMTLRLSFPQSIPVLARPRWLLYRQTEHRSLTERESHTCIDRTDLPVLPDPAVLGEWEAVDFVDAPAEFAPEALSCDCNRLWILGLTFTPGNLCFRHVRVQNGVRDMTYIYTRTGDTADGEILRPDLDVSEHYTVRHIEGADYLFVQHKSGDYMYGGMEPAWYVFRRPVR